MPEVAGSGPWRAIAGSVASATGDVSITGAPSGRLGVGFELADGTVITATESGTTSGTYKFNKSGTTASGLVYLIL